MRPLRQPFVFRYLLILGLCLGWKGGATATDTLVLPQITPSFLTMYDIEEGLPLYCVEKVIADPQGRLWVNPCRQQDYQQNLGFYLYDGDRSLLIAPLVADQDTTAWYLEGISPDGILFGTDQDRSQAFLFDPNTFALRSFTFEAGETIGCQIVGPNGVLWVITKNRNEYIIYQLSDQAKVEWDRIAVEKIEARVLKVHVEETYNIPTVLIDSTLWFVHDNEGFIRYDLGRKNIRHYHWSQVLSGELQRYDPSAGRIEFQVKLTADTQGNLVFYLPPVQGFLRFNLSSEQFSRLPDLERFAAGVDLGISSSSLQFIPDQSGNTIIKLSGWAGDFTGPFNSRTVLWDANGQLFDYQPLIAAAAKIGGHRFKEPHGFWGLDFKHRVLLALPSGLAAVEIQPDLAIRTFLPDWQSRGIGEIGANRLLVNSDNGSKKVIHLEDGTVSALPYVCRPGARIESFAKLLNEGPDVLWFPTGNQQLVRYSKVEDRCTEFPIGMKFNRFVFLNPREVAFVDNDDNGLYRYKLDEQHAEPFLHEGAPLSFTGRTNEVLLGRDGVIWIATLDGLWRVDSRTGASRRLGIAQGFPDERFMCLHEAEGGKIWIGTLTAGVNIYDPSTGDIRIIDEESQLSNNTVVGILSDEQGNRWVATFNGLTVLDSSGTVLFELQEKDGLAHREFNRVSYLKLQDGRLAFGGVSGISVLQADSILQVFSQRRQPLLLSLTQLRYFNKRIGRDVNRRSELAKPAQITLPANHRYLEIDFALSDYLNPKENLFSYRIDRGDPAAAEVWTTIGSASQLSLNDLPIGTYDLVIRGINAQGQMSENLIVLPLLVQPFFYNTWWFYLLCTIPIIGIIRFRARQLIQEKNRLEVEVAKRTSVIEQDKALIEEQAVRLREMDEIKSRFFTNISHEFRTPLTVITGMVTQIKKHPDQWLDRGIDLIQSNSRLLLSLINQILDLRKLESGHMDVNWVQGDVVAYLRYIVDSFVGLARAKNIRIHFLTSVPELLMDYDPEKLMHVLSNLLSNALKFTPEEGDIYLQLDHQKTSQPEQLQLQVKDTGAGISPEALPYIFDRFYQVEDLATQKPQGSGVGLALTQELVKVLKGTITVDSIPGVGTTFRLAFSITREAPLQAAMPDLSAASPTPKPLGATIPAAEVVSSSVPEAVVEAPDSSLPSLLIVEDNPDVRVYLTATLEPSYRLLIAKDGQEGIEQAIEQVPDLIVSDVMMPVKDGFALCDTLKNDLRTSHIPIVLLTARADFESKIEGLRRGADAYLSKPFAEEELKVRLTALLARRDQWRKRYENPTAEPTTPATVEEELEDVFIRKLRQVVLDKLTEESFGILPLCRALGVSRTQLHNKAKALTGLSTSALIRSIRLHQARELLQNTDLNVSEVGYEVGIDNPSHFSRVYAEEFGESPSETRQA